LKKFFYKSISVLFAILSTTLSAQFKKIPIDKLLVTRNAIEYYEDSANTFTGTFAPLEVRNFTVKIYMALIDTARKKAFVSGKACSSEACHPWGRPGVAIFKAKRTADSLNSKVHLGTSSFIRELNGSSIGGDFDVIFDFEKDDKLYFYFPYSWIVEYNIGKFLK